MKIAYTKNEISELILRDNIGVNSDINLINIEQDEIVKKLSNGLIEAALVDPITYSKLKKNNDVRIIPCSVLFLEDYTNTLGLNITSESSELNKLSLPFKSDYLYQISKLLLAERYQITIMDVPSMGGSEIVVNNELATLDISEDWYESFKLKLPLLFWVVKFDDGKVLVEDYVNLFNSISLTQDEVFSTDDQTRQGRIIRRWDNECEESLDETLELLFYHNLVDELFCSKLYSNDEDVELNDEEVIIK